MSRGFVKEDDQEEAPMIPPRAALPPGVTNYVTPRGMEELQEEKLQMEQLREDSKTENDTERRRALAAIDGKLNLLKERIASARILDPAEQPADEIRFGARVKFENLENGQKQEFQIVGVDEADVRKQKIAFVAPIAQAVTGKKKGEIAAFKMGNEVRHLKILDIDYPSK